MLTDKQKAEIAEWMGWELKCKDFYNYENCNEYKNCFYCDHKHNFDLNDAGLVVEKMQQNGKWNEFEHFLDDYHYTEMITVEFTAWLFTTDEQRADNFFTALATWIEDGKG